jgi:thioredoxin-like negative regulator of GroEL
MNCVPTNLYAEGRKELMRKNVGLIGAGVLAMCLALAGGCAREESVPSEAKIPAGEVSAQSGTQAPPLPPSVANPATTVDTASATTSTTTATIAPEGSVKWASSFAEATKLARAQNKPIMVDFWATWCGWCKKLDTDVYTTSEFANAAKDVISVKVDTEGPERDVAARFGVTNLPTVLYLTPEGKLLSKVGGYMSTDRFVPTVTAAVEMYRSIPGIKAKFASSPKDLTAAQQMVEISSRLDDIEGVEKAVDRVRELDPNDNLKFRTRSLLLFADVYARNKKFAKAAPLFEQAAKDSKDPEEMATAHRGAAICYALQKNFTKAKEQLQAIVDAPDSPEENKQEALQMLDRIDKDVSSRQGKASG